MVFSAQVMLGYSCRQTACFKALQQAGNVAVECDVWEWIYVRLGGGKEFLEKKASDFIKLSDASIKSRRAMQSQGKCH